ncbi:MAG: hypothetical protein V1900_01100 [Candidatus Aenigmatarchaeota archaeon]
MNKPMFWVGIALIAITALALLFVKEGLGVFPAFFGLLGIIMIGASAYRPMKKSKKR